MQQCSKRKNRLKMNYNNSKLGDELHLLCDRLFPINRSLTGKGVRKTLSILKEYLPEMVVFEVPSGTKCFDWTIPDEWNINSAYIISPEGEKIVDFQSNNLHVVGYSNPVDLKLSLKELEPHLHSLKDTPNAIPYVTSYYSEYWGFCMTDTQRGELTDGTYHAVIDSEKIKGSMTYGELIIKGKTDKEVLLSTYICHPSMANNELSGPVVATYIAKFIKSIDNYYTYRIIFIPETIGSIYYISTHLNQLKENVVAGYVLTCIGDDRSYSFLPSKVGDTLSDIAAIHALKHTCSNFISYSYLDRGSDERQYCSPGVDLPIASIMRSKYHEYPEYHTSMDNLEFVTPSGLFGGFMATKRAIESIENNIVYKVTQLCEPQLGKRGLYPNLGGVDTYKIVQNRMNLLAYADGETDLLSIANKLNIPIWDLHIEAELLREAGLLEHIGR